MNTKTILAFAILTYSAQTLPGDMLADMRPNAANPNFKAEKPWNVVGQTALGAGVGLFLSTVTLPVAVACFHDDFEKPFLISAGVCATVGGMIALKWHAAYQKAYDKNNGMFIRGLAAANDVQGVDAWLDYDVRTSYYDDNNGRGALHYAAANGSVEVLQLLLQNMPRTINLQVGTGWGVGHDGQVISTVSYAPFKTIDLRDDKFNRTAAVYAALENQIDALRVLLVAGANAGIADNFGNSVATIALRNDAVRKVLEEVQGK